MTSPITFDPLPVPVRTALADVAPSAAAQASTLDANFAKIGGVADTLRTGYQWTQRQVIQGGYYAGGATYYWDPTYWPPTTFTVPQGTVMILFWSELAVWVQTGLFIFIPEVTGSGLTGDWTHVIRQDFRTAYLKFEMGGVARFVDKVNPGGTVTIRPSYYAEVGTGPLGPNQIQAADGAYGAIALTG